MNELSTTYLNQLADQFIIIDSLLGGFSLAIVINLMLNDSDKRLITLIQKTATISAGSFLVSLFAMTRLVLMTTEGAPDNFGEGNSLPSRIIGMLTFFIGLVSLLVVVALSGWVKSRKLGWFTTVMGILTLLLLSMMMVECG